MLIVDFPPKYFLFNELFWKKVFGILSTILQYPELREEHYNGLVHVWKLIYIPFHRFSKSQITHLEILFSLILEAYTPTLQILCERKVMNVIIFNKSLGSSKLL